MYFVYVLRSLKDGKLYKGFTKNLELRLEQHNSGRVSSTEDRRPLELIYYEACTCISQQDATRREKYFKTFYGQMFLKKDSRLISRGEVVTP